MHPTLGISWKLIHPLYVPATRAVADVRNAAPLFERRGRPGPVNQARRIVRSSQSLVVMSTPERRQRVEHRVGKVQPVFCVNPSYNEENRAASWRDRGHHNGSHLNQRC